MNRPQLDVLAPEWGSTVTKPDNATFTPRYTILHWGGNTAHIPADDEAARLRSWQRTHLNQMSDLAYQIAVGDSGLAYEGRSWRSGGHTSTSRDTTPEGDSYNQASVGIVWIGGANAGTPSVAAIATMARLCHDLDLPVKGHRTVKQENGSSTTCPGDWWLNWIENRGWEDGTIDPTALEHIPDWAVQYWKPYIDHFWAGGAPHPNAPIVHYQLANILAKLPKEQP